MPRPVGPNPHHNRPRERLEALGPSALTDAELLTVIVGSGRAGASAVDVATALLERADHSLSDLARLPVRALQRVPGVGPACSSRVVASMEMGRRASREAGLDRPRVRGARDVYTFVQSHFRDLLHEEFHVLLLDAQHRVIRNVVVTRGILDASIVHPREVFRPAIEHSAAAVILVHNHPSGDPTPSVEDRAVTSQMRTAGRTVGIEVLDHVVVSRGGYASADPVSGLA